MLDFLETVASSFIGSECAETLIGRGELLDPSCLKVLLVKGVGFALILGSMLVRVPQVRTSRDRPRCCFGNCCLFGR